MCSISLTDIIRCLIGGAPKCRIVCTTWRGSTRSIRLDKWVAIVMMIIIILMVAVTMSTSGDWGARGGGAGGGVREGGGEVQALAQLSSWDDRPARGAHPHEQVFAIITRSIWTVSKRCASFSLWKGFRVLKIVSIITSLPVCSYLATLCESLQEFLTQHLATSVNSMLATAQVVGHHWWFGKSHKSSIVDCVLYNCVKVVWGWVDQCGETT